MVMHNKTWEVMNDLQSVTSKICSAREILDSAIDAHQEHKYQKVEALMYAVDEYLQYYLNEFDDKFQLAWQQVIKPASQVQNKKWTLPVQVDDAAGDAEPIYYVNFPDDLLTAANLKDGDEVEWIDNGDGSYTLKKV